jgi:exodeoxyribonuclease V beta subunit
MRSHGCPLFLIGDPKQSIYRFRGADIHAYLRAAKSASKRYTLLSNFRSTPAYVNAVEQLFTRAPDPFLVSETEIDFPRVTAADTPVPPGKLATDGRPALEWWWVDGALGTKNFVSKDNATQWLIRDIVNEIIRCALMGSPVGSIAVLLRSNREARQVKQALDRARVPSVVAGDADVLASEEASELARLAAAIAAPFDGRAVRSAMATRLWGSDATEIANAA